MILSFCHLNYYCISLILGISFPDFKHAKMLSGCKSCCICWYCLNLSHIIWFSIMNIFLHTVPCRTYPSSSEVKDNGTWKSWGYSCSLFCRYPWVFNCRGVGVGWQCKQGSEGEAYYTETSTACYPWRWRTWHSHQRNNCWWWCYSSYPQVSYQQILKGMNAHNSL